MALGGLEVKEPRIAVRNMYDADALNQSWLKRSLWDSLVAVKWIPGIVEMVRRVRQD